LVELTEGQPTKQRTQDNEKYNEGIADEDRHSPKGAAVVTAVVAIFRRHLYTKQPMTKLRIKLVAADRKSNLACALNPQRSKGVGAGLCAEVRKTEREVCSPAG